MDEEKSSINRFPDNLNLSASERTEWMSLVKQRGKYVGILTDAESHEQRNAIKSLLQKQKQWLQNFLHFEVSEAELFNLDKIFILAPDDFERIALQESQSRTASAFLIIKTNEIICRDSSLDLLLYRISHENFHRVTARFFITNTDLAGKERVLAASVGRLGIMDLSSGTNESLLEVINEMININFLAATQHEGKAVQQVVGYRYLFIFFDFVLEHIKEKQKLESLMDVRKRLYLGVLQGKLQAFSILSDVFGESFLDELAVLKATPTLSLYTDLAYKYGLDVGALLLKFQDYDEGREITVMENIQIQQHTGVLAPDSRRVI